MTSALRLGPEWEAPHGRIPALRDGRIGLPVSLALAARTWPFDPRSQAENPKLVRHRQHRADLAPSEQSNDEVADRCGDFLSRRRTRQPHVTVRAAMLALQLVLVSSDHLMVAGFLQTVRRAVVAFLVVVFSVGLISGGLVGFFSGWAVGRRG